MQPIVYLILYFAGLASALRYPIWGVMTYFLAYYFNPIARWWRADVPALRWSFIISMVLIATVLINKRSLRNKGALFTPVNFFCILLILNMLFVYPISVSFDQNTYYFDQYLKMYVFAVLLVMVVDRKKHLQYYIMAHVLGSFYWGYLAWSSPKRQGGRLYGMGGPDSLDDNSMAAHLLMVLPLLCFFILQGKRWQKLLGGASMLFVVNTIVLCNSRGAILGLGVMALMTFFIMKGWKQRLKGLLVVAMGIGLLLFLADPQFIERQIRPAQSGEYASDSSAQGRRNTWEAAWRLMKDRPLGVGGGGFELLSPIYIPDIVEAHEFETRAVHNTFLLVGTEYGFQGLFIYLAIVFLIVRNFRVVMKYTRSRMDQAGMKFYYYASTTGLIGFVGFMTAATFVSRLQAEAFWWMMAYSIILRRLFKEPETESEEAELVPDASPNPYMHGAPLATR